MSKQLVVYISATGTTRRVAQNLAKAIDADLAEIVPVPPFTAQDIEDSIAYIDAKEQFYEAVLDGTTPYVSNVLGLEE